MANPNLTIIEVNGVKLEVDMRTARRVDTLRIGTPVKVLTKAYNSHEVSAGVVVGFEPFAKLPTVVVAYVASNYDKAEIKFLHYNSASIDVEIVASVDATLIERELVVGKMNRRLAQKEREADAIRERIRYFEDRFGQYWEKLIMPVKDEAF